MSPKQQQLNNKVNKDKLTYIIDLATEPPGEYYKRVNGILNNNIREQLIGERLVKDIENMDINDV